MKKTTTIRSLRDLADHVGADRPEISSIARRIYKDTDCGAHLGPLERNTRTIRVRVEVRLSRSLRGILVTCRRAGKGPWMPVLPISKARPASLLPVDVRNSIATEFALTTGSIVDAAEVETNDLDKLREQIEANLPFWNVTRTKSGALICRDTLEALLPIAPRLVGVSIGSIVEGVDRTTSTVELLFPFSSDDFDTALESVENEAARIWDETHGCPRCAPEDQLGYRHVNKKCRACKGAGIVI